MKISCPEIEVFPYPGDEYTLLCFSTTTVLFPHQIRTRICMIKTRTRTFSKSKISPFSSFSQDPTFWNQKIAQITQLDKGTYGFVQFSRSPVSLSGEVGKEFSGPTDSSQTKTTQRELITKAARQQHRSTMCSSWLHS